MFGATPILFIGTVGNQIFAGPDGLAAVLHDPELDMENSLREIHVVVGQIVQQLGYEARESFNYPLHLLKELIEGNRPDLAPLKKRDIENLLSRLAGGLGWLKKERFEMAANNAMIHSGMAVLWSPPEAVRQKVAETLRPADHTDDHTLEGIVRRAKAQIEKEVIERTLGEVGGDVTQAARRLGLSRKNLRAKMKELRLR